ncbi:MAG: S-layer homology domain-containing protein [Bacillota bacterium]|nr:S-layer homology domain-containing protein [Bacillota bacterium]
MKKKAVSLLLALVMCLTLLPVTALAVGPVNKTAPVISDLAVYYSDEDSEAGVEFTLTITAENKELLAQYKEIGYGLTLEGEISIDGGEWQDLSLDTSNLFYADEYLEKDGQRVRSLTSPYISAEKTIKYRVNFFASYPDAGDWTGEYSNVLTLNEKVDFNASDWAQDELQQADELGLIPDVLQGADLTQDITRAEFAAVAVKVYEALSGTAAIPIVNNPFTDTNDVEVLKAYNIGAVNGMSATTFAPNDLLNREQAAAMLTRVFKRVTLAGWTLETDGQFTLDYTQPAAFADDANISAWAKDSVYFMVANGIINGVGNNMFAPKNVTSAEEAQGYANATREQALLIAVRMVQNLSE